MTHKHVLKSFDFTDLEQRNAFFEFIINSKAEGFLVQIKLLRSKGEGLVVGIDPNEIAKKAKKFGSHNHMPALPFYDLIDDEELVELSLKLITNVTLLKEMRDA